MSANVLYNNASKQIHALQQELSELEAGRDSSAAMQGQITAGLASLQRSAHDLEDFARREVTAVKKEKAIAWGKKVREEYQSLQTAFAKWKADERAKTSARDREALLGAGHVDRRTSSAVRSNDPKSADTNILMEHMMRESNVLNASGNRMDEFLHMGTEVLRDLYEQRDTLKGTQRKLYDVANHLGLSASVIKYIERRSAADKWIFFGGVIITLIIMWAIVHYLG